MSPAALIREVIRRGHSVWIDNGALVIRPKMEPALREQVRLAKLEIVAYLSEFGGDTAAVHAFTALCEADAESIRARGVCIACGRPWEMHGEPPIETWQRVDDPDTVALVQATAIVWAASAREDGP